MSLSRRRYLLSVVNLEKYRELLMNYIYHNIIPDTIDGKNVKDTGKTKLLEIFGNGEIESQLIENGDFSNGTTGWLPNNTSTISIISNVVTLTCATAGTSTIYRSDYSYKAGRKYLVVAVMKATSGKTLYISGMSNSPSFTATGNWQLCTYIDEPSSKGSGYPRFGTKNAEVGDTIQYKYCKFIDLTQRYGAGNEPTALTDNRIKKIIDEGYEPKNTGTYKSSVVESVETKGFNIWDEEWEVGQYDSETGLKKTGNGIRSANKMEVIPNASYYVFGSNESLPFYVCFYQKDGTYLYRHQTTFKHVFIIPNNVYYIAFNTASAYGNTYNNDICINRSGARNGTYVPHRWQDFYQQVEYIESTGTQWIDSGIVGNENTKIEFTGARTQNYSNSSWVGGDLIRANAPVSGSGTLGRFLSKVFVGSDIPYKDYGVKNIVLLDKNNYILNGITYNLTGTISQTSDTTTIKTTGYTSESSSLYNSYLRLWNLKIYDNNTLVRNFIPCYRKSDIVIGLYDTVTGQFFTNQGTGTFLKGNDVLMDNQIKLPAPMELAGVNTAHNTFEITKTAYVFTRNVWNYDLSNYIWAYNSDLNGYITSGLASIIARPIDSNTKVNLISTKYLGTARNDTHNNNDIYVVSSNGNTVVYDTAQSGNPTGTIMCQLATPQVISIPRKHLKALDLGSLDYQYESTYQRFLAPLNGIKTGSVRTIPMYCSEYQTLQNGEVFNSSWNMVCYGAGTSVIYIHNHNYTNATDFKNAMSGIYLFYETQDEVDDFIDTALFQRGGEITTYGELYDEVEYIESSGTQYIDTEFSDKNGYIIKANITPIVNTSGILFGCADVEYANRQYSGLNAQSQIGINNATTTKVLNANTKYNVEVSLVTQNLYVKVDGTNEYTSSSVNMLNEDVNVVLFARNVAGTINGQCSTRFHDCIVYDSSNKIVRDFVPAIRKKDQVAGLYDKVTGKFYTNKGTGTFVAGAYVRTFDSNECLPDLKMKVQVK